MKKGKVDYTKKKNATQLLNFINATLEGKYTKDKPVLTDLKFRRIEIQEQNNSIEQDDNNEMLLFGSSY